VEAKFDLHQQLLAILLEMPLLQEEEVKNHHFRPQAHLSREDEEVETKLKLEQRYSYLVAKFQGQLLIFCQWCEQLFGFFDCQSEEG
jgi:hypothetical protein